MVLEDPSKEREKKLKDTEVIPSTQDPKRPEASEAKTEQKLFPLKEYEDLLARLHELENLREKFLRTAADFENAKKRLAKEKEEFLKYGQQQLLRSLLPTLDNLQRALAHRSDENVNLKGLIDGIELIYKHLTDILKDQGLERLETVGKDFDPHLHEAVGHVEEEGKENEIVEEIEPGYCLQGRLLKAARVRVRIPPSPIENPKKK